MKINHLAFTIATLSSLAFSQGIFHYNSLYYERISNQISSVNQLRVRNGLAAIPQATLDSLGQTVTTDIANEIEPTATGIFSASVNYLPVHVDNSKLKFFPPIADQGAAGSCQSFSYAYYMASHELALARNWDNTLPIDSQLVSALWVYNQNANIVVPSTLELGDVLKTHGAVFSNTMPYSTSSADFLTWPTDSSVWKKALDYRALNYYHDYAYKYTTNNLNPIKMWLANGHVLSVSTNILGFQYDVVKDDIATSADDSLVGKNIIYRVSNTQNLGHLMTLVGYDDEIWTDINANGVLDVGEKGAFKLANSWGSSWGDHGFVWIAYDAIVNPSLLQVVNTRTSAGTKQPGFQDFNWIVYPSQKPTHRLTARITMEHNIRGNLKLYLGKGELNSNVISDSLLFPYFDAHGGSYSLDGTHAPTRLTFFANLEDVGKVGVSQRFWLKMNNVAMYAADSCRGIIHEFTVIDSSASGVKEWSATNTPLQVGKSATGGVYVDYVWTEPTNVYMPKTFQHKNGKQFVMPGQAVLTIDAPISSEKTIAIYRLSGARLWCQKVSLVVGQNQVHIPTFHDLTLATIGE